MFCQLFRGIWQLHEEATTFLYNNYLRVANVKVNKNNSILSHAQQIYYKTEYEKFIIL